MERATSKISLDWRRERVKEGTLRVDGSGRTVGMEITAPPC